MRARVRLPAVGQEALCVEVYALLSGYVHAGAAGTAGIGKEALAVRRRSA
jgi:hypothetical protein